jgi:hypothetical protein
MENKRDSFIFYRSFYEAIKELPEKDQLLLYKAILKYSLDFEDSLDLKGFAKTVFILIKPQLEANRQRFLNGVKPKNKNKKIETIGKEVDIDPI